MGLTIERRMWMVDDDALNGRWMREQALLGLDRSTSNEEFARGGLGAFAADPTVRIAVLPGDPSSQPVPAEKPEEVIPKTMTVGGRQLAYHGIVRGTSSGYVGYTIGNEGRWQSFAAVHWHGGVDAFLGVEGGREWDLGPQTRGRVFFLQRSVGWAWGAFDLQQQVVERYEVAGPFRVIVTVAKPRKIRFDPLDRRCLLRRKLTCAFGIGERTKEGYELRGGERGRVWVVHWVGGHGITSWKAANTLGCRKSGAP